MAEEVAKKAERLPIGTLGRKLKKWVVEFSDRHTQEVWSYWRTDDPTIKDEIMKAAHAERMVVQKTGAVPISATLA